MTDQQINAAIAEITGSNKLVGLKKRGMWWRHKARGYTYNESEAWRITEEEAKKYARPNDIDAVTVERFKPIDYCNDLNAIMRATQQTFGTAASKLEYTEQLTRACKTDGWVILSASDAFDLIHATARQRAEAFLRALGKWEEVKL